MSSLHKQYAQESVFGGSIRKTGAHLYSKTEIISYYNFILFVTIGVVVLRNACYCYSRLIVVSLCVSIHVFSFCLECRGRRQKRTGEVGTRGIKSLEKARYCNHKVQVW